MSVAHQPASDLHWLTRMQWLWLFCGLVALAAAQENPVVDVPAGGTIQGFWSSTWEGRRVASYTKIPYAKPPVGDLRFALPQPADPWRPDVLDATQAIPYCIQNGGSLGQEDCLYLNVFSPEGADQLPVIFYIHGGGLRTGSATSHADANFLLDFNVILVSINYRLGQLGFLAVEETNLTGNLGFRDQLLALKWVSENIAAFGGNPNKVTIMGESAGSWSVMHHVISPESSGLLTGAIGHSGTPLGKLSNTPLTMEESQNWGRRVTEEVGCNREVVGSENILACLKDLSAETLIATDFLPRGTIDGGFVPNPFLPDDPNVMMANGNFNYVPVLLGANSGEAILFVQDILNNPDILDDIGRNWDSFYGPLFIFEREGNGDIMQEDQEIARQAREFYFAPDGIIDQTRLDRFVLLYSDTLFQYGVHKMSEYLSNTVPTYQYLLTYEGSLSWFNKTGVSSHGFDLGVAHVDDLQFVFTDSEPEEYSAWTEADDATRRRMCSMWADFANLGNPTPGGEGQSNDIVGDFIWSPVSQATIGSRYLNFGVDLSMDESLDYAQRMTFWDTVLG